jgi:hypothetical protein
MTTGHVIAQEPHFLQRLASIVISTILGPFGLLFLMEIDVESHKSQQNNRADRGETA